MKFVDYPMPIIVDKHGFKWAKKGIMISEDIKACISCGQPTFFIDSLSEAYMCSDECVEDFYKMVSKFEQID